MNGTRRATSQDVAALAGVSQATVSRAFTPGASISLRTREKIESAAEKLGYKPNIIARSLSKRQSRLIGLLFADWTHPKAADLLKRITEVLTEHGYKVIVQSASSGRDAHAVMLDFLQYQVDGVIVFSAALSPETSSEYARNHVPIVILNRPRVAQTTSSVSVDGTGIGQQIATALLARPYRRLTLISANQDSPIVNRMMDAIVSSTAARPDVQILSRLTGIDGYEAGKQAINSIWQDKSTTPDAIICTSDNTALGILAGCREHLNIHVPAELAIVGLGDVTVAAWKDHNLSTVRIPHDEMVNKSVELLLERIQDPSLPAQMLEYQAQFIARGTT